MADRFCGNCGQELRPDDKFCPSCGRAIHETAVVPTPEADVAVPPLPTAQGADAGEAPNAEGGGRVSSADSTRNAFTALGAVVAFIVLLIVAGSVAGGQGIGVVLMLSILPALALLLRGGKINTGNDAGRLVLREGADSPIRETERSRILDEEIAEYSRAGFFVRHRTPTTAQLVKPKQFSFLWALLWFLVFGIGIVVYLVYYAAKQDEGRYVEVDEYGAVRATRQVRNVL